jgi:hypothetical protein
MGGIQSRILRKPDAMPPSLVLLSPRLPGSRIGVLSSQAKIAGDLLDVGREFSAERGGAGGLWGAGSGRTDIVNRQ